METDKDLLSRQWRYCKCKPSLTGSGIAGIKSFHSTSPPQMERFPTGPESRGHCAPEGQSGCEQRVANGKDTLILKLKPEVERKIARKPVKNSRLVISACFSPVDSPAEA